MSRIRALKPDFFKDEDLATLRYEARLLYAGLWCFADREGRLEDRPKYLKAEIFPYDNIDIEKLLILLSNPNIPDRQGKVFIRRYSVNNRNYIDIPEFLKHQTPHHTEKKSSIPSFNGELTVNEPIEKGNVQDAHSPISLSESLPLNKNKKTKYLDSVLLADDEYKKLQEALGQKNLDAGIEQLDYSITVKSGKYKDHYKVLLNWYKRGFLNGNGNGNGQTPDRDPPPLIVSCPVCGGRVTRSDLTETGCVNCRAGMSP
ncbi:MAG: hypothetical protein M0R00_06905 [Candidatus Omnitrophica bacterium]|jgi:hypothetical protein|nr:hypothetical protein [Candidatus Omnitrophota bacterium]